MCGMRGSIHCGFSSNCAARDGSRPRQRLISEEEYYGGYSDGDHEDFDEGSESGEESPEVVSESEESSGYGVETGATQEEPSEQIKTDKLSNTQAMNSFNSLPESVRRAVMDADNEDSY